ncbi:hypothetical protein [Leptolyngbya iicbica]|uniref:Uncharacterized protein n=2 Tax=Cyanophyceae TaxID=3028117 RepID=A0A4Q7E5J3_9CYAN|nr:hypothetical protein [Leptolyngbya sp. LK]RZM77220.1 hypothetical protein DYY88_16365 [Leptolyngbya sp. LK]
MMRLSGLIALLGLDLYCLVLLWCGVWPGRLGEAMFWTIILGMLALAVAVFFSVVGVIVWGWRAVTRSRRRARTIVPKPRAYPLKRVAIATAIFVVFTYVALSHHWPMRVAFGLSKPAFTARLADAPVTDQNFSEFPLNERLGVYYVTYYAADSGGSVYFQTGFHGFWAAPHGFAYQPNDQGSPFGHTGHFFAPVAKDWYLFRASHDW